MNNRIKVMAPATAAGAHYEQDLRYRLILLIQNKATCAKARLHYGRFTES